MTMAGGASSGIRFMRTGDILKTESSDCGGVLRVVEHVAADTYLTECQTCEEWWEYDEVTSDLERDN